MSAVRGETDDTGAHAIRRAERGEEAFARARRHSRRVRFLKFALPGAAVAISVLFVGYSLFASSNWGAVNLGLTSIENGELVMRNPSLDGFTNDNRPYSMTAARARQAVGDDMEPIRLEGIRASLPIDAEDRATISAEAGVFDRRNERLILSETVTVTTTSGMVARMRSAEVDIDASVLNSDQPVEIEMDGMRLSAGTFRASEGGSRLVFENRVRVELDPSRFRQRQDQNEESLGDE